MSVRFVKLDLPCSVSYLCPARINKSPALQLAIVVLFHALQVNIVFKTAGEVPFYRTKTIKISASGSGTPSGSNPYIWGTSGSGSLNLTITIDGDSVVVSGSMDARFETWNGNGRMYNTINITSFNVL